MPSSVGTKLAAFFLYVLAILNRGENGCVGRGAAHAVGFELLDQRCFVVARRRLGEMLLRQNLFEAQRLAFGDGGQLVL